MLFQQALEAEGYQVLSAQSGVEALDILKAEAVDVMLLDVRMPDMHGLELLDRLRSQGSTIPTVLCTAMSKAGDAFEARAYGVRSILTKPVDLDDLRARVLEAVEGDLTGARPQDQSQTEPGK